MVLRIGVVSMMRENKSLYVIMVALILIIMGLGFYICYDKGIVFGKSPSKPADETDKPKEDTTVSLDINGPFVKDLYMKVESHYRIFNNVVVAKEIDLKAKDIDYAIKFQMAYELLLASDIVSFDCNKYDARKYFDQGEPLDSVSCGGFYNLVTNRFQDGNTMTVYEQVLKEDSIRNRVEQF